MVDNLFLLDLPWFSMASPLFSSSHPSSQQSNPSAGGIPADGKAKRNLMDLDPKWCPTPNKEPITNPLMPEPTYQKYLVISGGEGVDLFEKTTLSQRFHFFKDNGIDFARLEKLKSGDILLTSKGPVSTAKAKKVQTILDIKVNVSGHKALNSSKGVVKNPELRNSTPEELIALCPNVTEARQICKRDGTKTNSWVLTFSTPTPPLQLKAGYRLLDVRPYVPNPMRCKRCHRFGHTLGRCKKVDQVCPLCGGTDHGETPCNVENPCCLNCKQKGHPATSPQCEVYKKEQAILADQARLGGTFAEARERLFPKPRHFLPHSFASAVDGKASSQQPPSPAAEPPFKRKKPEQKNTETQKKSLKSTNRFDVLAQRTEISSQSSVKDAGVFSENAPDGASSGTGQKTCPGPTGQNPPQIPSSSIPLSNITPSPSPSPSSSPLIPNTTSAPKPPIPPDPGESIWDTQNSMSSTQEDMEVSTKHSQFKGPPKGGTPRNLKKK